MESDKKEALYKEAKKEIIERLNNAEGGIVPRMATVTSVLKNAFDYYFWCGFYFTEEEKLIVGPYQGTSACANIEYSGCCGTAATKKETIVIPNVHEFPGHIPCDEKSNAEIVVPLIDGDGRVVAVFDVDSTEINAFDAIDKKNLEEILPILLEE